VIQIAVERGVAGCCGGYDNDDVFDRVWNR
jgi:hypothetical protein